MAKVKHKAAKEFFGNVIMQLIFCPIYLLLGLGFAWFPMLAWNHGVANVFPQLPQMNYWQAFWTFQFAGYLIQRPRVEIKDPA